MAKINLVNKTQGWFYFEGIRRAVSSVKSTLLTEHKVGFTLKEYAVLSASIRNCPQAPLSRSDSHSSPNVYSILLEVIFLKYTEVHSIIRLVV